MLCRAFRDLRRHLGMAPMWALFGVLAGPIAAPHTPGGCSGGQVLTTALFLSRIGSLRVRIITAYVSVTCAEANR